jgi:hypothetical protein
MAVIIDNLLINYPEHNLIFDAITDEGDGPTYYVLADGSDEIFSPLKYKTFGKNEFIATLKDILKSVK